MQLRVSVTNTDFALLQRFVARYGARIYEDQTTTTPSYWKPRGIWVVFNHQACDFLDAIVPYIGGQKAKAVRIGRRWRQLLTPVGKRVPRVVRRRRERLAEALDAINQSAWAKKRALAQGA